MVLVHDPLVAGPVLFAEGATSEELIEAPGFEAKLQAISGKIASGLETALVSAKIARDSDAWTPEAMALMRPWSDQAFPENVVSSVEQQYYANDRVISAILGHLVEHMVIGEELRSIAGSARRRAADELGRIPPAMVDFVNRLMASGVVVEDVRKMSRQRLASVVAVLKEVPIVDALAEVEGVPLDVSSIPHKSLSSTEDGSPFMRKDSEEPSEAPSGIDAAGGDVPPVMGAEGVEAPAQPAPVSPAETVDEAPAEAVSEVVDGEVPAGMPDGGSVVLDGVSDGSVTAPRDGSAGDSETGSKTLPDDASERSEPRPPTTGLDLLDGIAEPVPEPASEGASEPVDEPMPQPVAVARPKGMWDDIDLTPLGYRIEDATASTDADMVALKLVLPTARSLREIALPKSTEIMLADGVDGQKDRTLYDKFLRTYSDRKGVRISEMEKRVLALLLVDLRNGGKGKQLGLPGWYHGVVLPGTDGSTRVRRIVSIDQSDAALEGAFAR